jgi:hypothetical protein
VATVQTQEDLFVLLGEVAHHFDHEDGMIQHHDMRSVAEDLLISLRNALLLRDGSKRQYFRSKLSHDRALQCTVLVTAIEMLLQCSNESVADGSLFRDELAISTSMPKVLNLIVAWDGGETEVIRLLAISNSIKIIRRIGPLCQEATSTFLDALLNVLRSQAPPEIHVEAANAIAYLFDQQDRTARRKRVIEKIQDDSSLIISTLSTAALQASNEDADEILTGLFNFAVNSYIFRAKIAKRRCTILAIGKHLGSPEIESRKLALNICKCLLNDPMSTTAEPVRIDGNHELLIGKVMQLAVAEKELMIQLYAISLLGDAVKNINLTDSLVDKIMDTLMELADSDGHDDVVMEASVTYTKAAAAMQPEEISEEVLINIVDFTTLPFLRTRTHAIAAIELFVLNDSVAQCLLAKTEMLDNFAMILIYGSPTDAVDVTNIIRFLAHNSAYQSMLCQNKTFLNALIKLVTQEEIIDRASYAGGVETVLALLSNSDNVRSFLPFPDLLPVLVSMANTVSEEESKQRLVTAIVRLSSALLG